MLKKRIIPCLDIQNGQTVKGVNFVNIRQAGDPVELAQRYAYGGADELVLLDITATVEERGTFVEVVENVARAVHIPFTVGGGISSVAQVAVLLQAGADKVSINSAAVRRPDLIDELAAAFGSQCVVVAIDAMTVGDTWHIATHGGRQATELECVAWAREAEQRGAGELLLTSMSQDGTKAGFALDLTRAVAEAVNIPVIASGGAGTVEHFVEVFDVGRADAALAAGIFHFGEMTVAGLKEELVGRGVRVRSRKGATYR